MHTDTDEQNQNTDLRLNDTSEHFTQFAHLLQGWGQQKNVVHDAHVGQKEVQETLEEGWAQGTQADIKGDSIVSEGS